MPNTVALPLSVLRAGLPLSPQGQPSLLVYVIPTMSLQLVIKVGQILGCTPEGQSKRELAKRNGHGCSIGGDLANEKKHNALQTCFGMNTLLSARYTAAQRLRLANARPATRHMREASSIGTP